VRTLQEQGCPELTIYQIIEVYRYVIHYYEIDLQRLPSRFDQKVNVDLRIHYLTNQISEDEFKIKLQRRQKDTEKKIEYRDIGETYVEIMNDISEMILEEITHMV
jgi:preprotein translocase subunit SecB